ncbi:hypothetical protein [Pseudoclavibacter sp. VKM Ac-2867]|uniref:hypothetical protein n=1 Tax=Pseudoclavibacter sp. VKM Ac-2867 TaxID=2783829 RepID=UPI00188DAEFD|nr:hypothetical protein [Pseudoclavibacter sp. VKM Ac-2867]MBF4459230.1 hypothetical protein [Pseudoclavibacter sp. VKM Ac-2867]
MDHPAAEHPVSRMSAGLCQDLTIKHVTKLSAVAAAILLPAALAGCTSGPADDAQAAPDTGTSNTAAPTFADLTASPANTKDLPADLPDSALDGADIESIRWVGEHEGTDVWLAAPVDGSEFDACILAFPDAQNWTSGCGGGVSGPDQRWYAIVPDGEAPPEDSTALSENVYVQSE